MAIIIYLLIQHVINNLHNIQSKSNNNSSTEDSVSSNSTKKISDINGNKRDSIIYMVLKLCTD